MKESRQEILGSKNEHFDWRDYVGKPENVPLQIAAKLDELSGLINNGGEEAEEFLDGLKRDQYRKVPLSLVQFFRDILNPEERRDLMMVLGESEPRGFKK